MDERYGAVFQKIRKGRGISLQKATGKFFSPSMLSRFENGQSEMSAEKLFDCLDNIYLSISEFDYLLKGLKNTNLDNLISEIHMSLYPFNKSILDNLISEELKKAKKDGRFKFHKLNTIMIKAAIKSQDPSYDISSEEIDYLSDYLFGMDIWIEYELLLFTTTYLLFPAPVLLKYCDEIMQKTELFKNSWSHSNLVQTILLNIVSHLTESNQLEFAGKVLGMFENNFLDTRDAYMRLIYRLVLGYYQVKGNKSEGKELILKTLETMAFLDLQKQADYYREQLKEFL